mmetsp:Transcript_5360/g.16239  ORF Transcript_5360/g.16239 Transcript_5360/m.16239 type:complete len:102 (-) Transcript_5360:933-1238(-)
MAAGHLTPERASLGPCRSMRTTTARGSARDVRDLPLPDTPSTTTESAVDDVLGRRHIRAARAYRGAGRDPLDSERCASEASHSLSLTLPEEGACVWSTVTT